MHGAGSGINTTVSPRCWEVGVSQYEEESVFLCVFRLTKGDRGYCAAQQADSVSTKSRFIGIQIK